MKIYSTSGAVGNVRLTPRLNRLKVLDCIRMKGVVARPEIAAETGLSLSSITNITKYLLKENLITETGRTETGAVGRKAVLLKLNHDAMSIISHLRKLI